MGNLDKNAGTVTGFRIAAASSPMGQIDEDFDAFTDDFVGFLTVEIDHEAHPARVVFVERVVEPLPTWRVFHALPYTI